MNSCIYKVKVGHSRIYPKKNTFQYGMYMFYIDLDEIEKLDRKFKLFSYNKWNIHSFYDEDHFTFINPKSDTEKIIAQENLKFDSTKYKDKKTKERVQVLLSEINQNFDLGKVYLLTSLRNYGYLFNPVSFYYCFDKENNFRVLISEVSNTWRQQKIYYYINDDFDKKVHQVTQPKNFYISPFVENDTELSWHFEVPNEKLLMLIKSSKNDKLCVSASLHGKKQAITNFNLFFILLRYPLVTLMVIWRIHWQAFKLWRKKVIYLDKNKADKKTAEQLINKTKNV